jgi:hypothetical protein
LFHLFLIKIFIFAIWHEIEVSLNENIAGRRVVAKVAMQYKHKVDCWGAN